MRKMDLREAKACLEEYRVSLDAMSGKLKTSTGEDKHRDAIERRKVSLILALLEMDRKEALILSETIVLEMCARDGKQILDFLDEWTEIVGALNKLWVAIDKAQQARAEYLDPDEAKEKAKRDPNMSPIIIRKDL
jgi:hypothetical protein